MLQALANVTSQCLMTLYMKCQLLAIIKEFYSFEAVETVMTKYKQSYVIE